MNKRQVSLTVRTAAGRKRLRLKIATGKQEEVIKRGYIVPELVARIKGDGAGIGEAAEGHEEEKEPEGVAIPDIATEIEELKAREPEDIRKEVEEIRRTDVRYPLVQHEGTVFAYARISFDQKLNELIYEVIEPKLNEKSLRVLAEIKDYIQEKVDIDFSQLRKTDALGHITPLFDKALNHFRAKFSDDARKVLRYYIFRDFVGLERLEPLLNDKQIEDISCDGVGISIFVYHRNSKFGSMRTNVVFENREELDSFVAKVAERCGRTISVAYPLLDGTLPDGSRVQATLASDIARRGSNFTLRMFTEEPMTPADTIRYGTCDLKIMSYLWLLIEHGSSMLVSGGTATGKTSLLNVLSMFIKPQMKIVSIEDTAELRLPHAHWVPEVARTPIAEEGKVDMFELLRESLRQRPDYIIVGEVRGREAYVLFQQMAVGHPGLSTIHAENFPKLVDRLTSPPIDLPGNLLQNLDVVMFPKRVKKENKFIRRVSTVVEVVGYSRRTKMPKFREIFRWEPKTDTFRTINASVQLRKVADAAGLTDKEVQNEMKKRAKVIEWMIKKNLTDYRQIGAVINMFYTYPEYLIEKITAEL